jgi:hypothetical protein
MLKLRTVMAFGAGLAAAYFLDPQQGPRRRNEALRRIQGEVTPQARAKVQDKVTSLQEAGKEVVQRANPRKAAEVTTPEATTPSPAPGATPPITES